MEQLAQPWAAVPAGMYTHCSQFIHTLIFEPLSNVISGMVFTTMPWETAKNWSPFKLDALGLVTLLGAEEVNKAIGSLQKRKLTECLPLLAANVIAGDRIRDEQAGFSICNVTDGICTTELKGWFTRWLSSQTIRNATTTFHWQLVDQPKRQTSGIIISLLSFGIMMTPLLVFTIVMGDWYGLSGTIAIIVNIASRRIMLWQLRTGLSTVAGPVKPPWDLPLSTQDANRQHTGSDANQLDQTASFGLDREVTLFVTRSDGRMVTIYAPRSMLFTFVKDSEIPNRHLYHTIRWFSWAAFGVLLVTLGMSSLFTQIYTVVLLVLSTCALCYDFDYDLNRRRTAEYHRGTAREAEVVTIPLTSKIAIIQRSPAKRDSDDCLVDKRMYAYIWASLTSTQEDMLRHWSMLPFRGVDWYKEYDRAKEAYARSPLITKTVHVSKPATTPSADSSTSENSPKQELHTS